MKSGSSRDDLGGQGEQYSLEGFGVEPKPVKYWLLLVSLAAPPGGRRVKRFPPGGYRQGSTFRCVLCGLQIHKTRTAEHLRSPADGEMSECRAVQARAARAVDGGA